MADDIYSYKPIKDTDMEMYNEYKTSIESGVRQKYPSIPADFELKPVRARHLEACGIIHDYKLALPNNQYVKISFLTGGMYMPPPDRTPDWKPPPPEISVSDTPTALPDDE